MDISEIRNLSNEDLAKTIRETEVWDENIPNLIDELCSRAGMSNELEIIDPEYVYDLAEKAAKELNVTLGTDFPVLLAYGYVDHDTGDTFWRDEYDLTEHNGKLFLDTVYDGNTSTKELKEVDAETAKQLIQQYNMSVTEEGAKMFGESLSAITSAEPLMENQKADNNFTKETENEKKSEPTAEKPADDKAYNQEQATIKNPEKNIGEYEKFDVKAFSEKFNEIRQANRQTLFPLAYMVANYASKLNDLKIKQGIIDNKISRREHKAERLEAKAVRRENTNKMFDELYAGKKMPSIIKAIYERNEKKIAKIRDNRIPQNQHKLDRQKTRSIANQGAIRLKFAQIDKMQNLSNVIKSFVITDPDKRREAFAKSLDELHDASKRTIQCKIERADMKIERLTEKMFAKSENNFDTYSLAEKITKQSERKNTLSQKLDKLQSLDKPFAQQEDKVVDSISEDVKLKVVELEQNPEAGEVKLSEFAEDLAVSCTEKANEKNRTIENEKAVPSVDKPSVFKEVEKIKGEQKVEQTDKTVPAKEKKPVNQEL